MDKSDIELFKRNIIQNSVLAGRSVDLDTLGYPLMEPHELANLLGNEFCEALRKEAYNYKSKNQKSK